MMCLKKLPILVFALFAFGFLLVPFISNGQASVDPPPGDKGPVTCCQADADGCTDRSGGYWETDRTYFNITTCP